jgi:hypothetical protein
MPLRSVLVKCGILTAVFGILLVSSGAAKQSHKPQVKSVPCCGQDQPIPICPPSGCGGH